MMRQVAREEGSEPGGTGLPRVESKDELLKSTHEHQLDYISTADEKKKQFQVKDQAKIYQKRVMKIKNILILILEKGLTEEADMLD